MEYRPLGRTGVLVSPICLGAMNFGGPTDADESVRIINAAIDAGINFIDTANVYTGGESERLVGRALRERGCRDEVVLATKCGMPLGGGPLDRGHSRVHILKACDDSLRRLGTDHIDLYQIHRPSLDVPQDETLRAFDDLVRAGKVRHVGCSTHPAWMVMEALATSARLGLSPYVSEQPPYNLLDRRVENELIPLCQRYGLAVLPWSPLGGGILTGRYSPDDRPEGSKATRHAPFARRLTSRAIAVASEVARLAAERGLNAAQLALLWIRDQPGVTAPIVGPRTMGHLDDALKVVDAALDPGDRERFDELVPPGTAVADFHNTADWMTARIEEP